MKPVLAALLAASSAAFALPGISRAALLDGAPAGAEKNPVNALASLIAREPEARKDIGERLARFVAGQDESGRRYVTAGLLGDAQALPAALEAAKAWPEKNKDNPGKIAVLYFVMGPDGGSLPEWAQTPLLTATFQPKMTWSARLADALASRHWTDASQIAQSGAVETTAAFLDDAAEQARKVLEDPGPKKDFSAEITAAFGAPDAIAVAASTAAPGPSALGGSGFGFDDLYKTGAEVANVYGPYDQGYRTLSMKVYTMRDANGDPINKIGIADITAGDITSPSLPQFIDSSRPGDTDIVMHLPGGRHYTVTVGSDGSVTLKRAGAKDGGPGSMTTSKAQLSADRDAQIMNSGTAVIGGLTYYVLGQGGQKGSFLFFSQAQMQASPGGNAHPELMGDVAQVVGDGATTPILGHPDLGELQDGSTWHLEFDMQTRLWKTMPGSGDKSKADGTGDPPAAPQPAPPAVATAATTVPDASPAVSTAAAAGLVDEAVATTFQP